MKTLKDFPKTKVRFVFTDIDDTLTDQGRLEEVAFSSLWKLFESGVHIIPVTGRPAGWCEMIARQWPVSGVVGENGGFYFRYVSEKNKEKKMKRHFVFDEAERKSNSQKLLKIKEEVLNAVPQARIASDQFCRLMDLAIDFAEDVGPLTKNEVDEIVRIFKAHGAQAKVSSIHVNGWFGDYNKLSMCQIFMKNEFGLNLADIQNEVLFVGDSPNDEPMFEFFKNSIAVANIHHFVDELTHKPKYITEKPRGQGFADVVKRVIGAP